MTVPRKRLSLCCLEVANMFGLVYVCSKCGKACNTTDMIEASIFLEGEVSRGVHRRATGDSPPDPMDYTERVKRGEESST